MSRVGRCALLVICLLAVTAGAQLPAREGKGIPRTAPSIDDVYANFKTPPRGYGEVAFYWWVG
ncbi:MAG: hypothetical protein H6Q28_1949, partial [Bacteroidetes bacterium]|nr:hypothetical protein [Bacteroidota bacterium]